MFLRRLAAAGTEISSQVASHWHELGERAWVGERPSPTAPALVASLGPSPLESHAKRKAALLEGIARRGLRSPHGGLALSLAEAKKRISNLNQSTQNNGERQFKSKAMRGFSWSNGDISTKVLEIEGGEEKSPNIMQR